MNRIKNNPVARLVLSAAMVVTWFALPLTSQAATYSYTDLNPSGFRQSYGESIFGIQQVGLGSLSALGPDHALLWSGTASSAVDLNPHGFTSSYARGISGGQQVGYGQGPASGGNYHALLWSGSASSAVDLNPVGFAWSRGYGISGTQQVGYGYGSTTGNNTHAFLWSGTASSVVDLNPSGFIWSLGLGISGNQQVGYGSTGGNEHALLWSGTASSVLDLGDLLSPDYSYSEAEDIDANGNVVGRATYIPTGQFHAILWTVVPEPGGVTLLVFGGVVLLRRKRI